jgi:hypothetical protein
MYLQFTDPLYLIDAQHPEYLDWRKVYLSIEETPSQIRMYFKVARKSDGRSVQQLAQSMQFIQGLEVATQQFYCSIDDAGPRDEVHIRAALNEVTRKSWADDGAGDPYIFLRFRNKYGDPFPTLRGRSNHELLKIQQKFSSLSAYTDARRRGPVHL